MFYRQLSVSCAAKFLLLASFLAFSQSTLANEGAETGLKHRVEALEAQIVEINSVLADYEARLAALEDGGPEEPPNEEWACSLWSEQDMLTFNTPWRDDLYLPAQTQGLSIDTRRTEYESLAALWTIAYETYHKESGETWTIFNVLQVWKRAETGEFEASAFKGARPGDRFTSGPWNDFLDPNFNADQISISRSDFINCAKTLYSGILPNDDILYSANYDTDDGLDPRSEDWDWEEELGH